MKRGLILGFLLAFVVGISLAWKNVETFKHLKISKSLRVTGPTTLTGPMRAQVKTAVNIGALAGTNVTTVEYGEGTIHQTVLTLAATPVTLTDEAGVVLYGGQKVYDFAQGNILILGAVIDADVTVAGDFSATADGDIGLGTVTASNNNSLSGTEQNIVPTTAIPQLVDSAGTSNGLNAAAIAPLDGTTTAIDVFLNYIWDDADHDGGTMTVTGTIKITWINLGDY